MKLQKIINNSAVFLVLSLFILSQFFISIKMNESGKELNGYFEFVFNLSGYSGMMSVFLLVSFLVFITSMIAGINVNSKINKNNK